MKFKLTFMILIIGFLANAQNPDIIRYNEISINGISSQSVELKLISVFGKPNSITEPNYDCGPLSSEWNNVNVKLYKWNGIEFHCVDGVMEIGKIDFSKTNLKVKTNQLTFDKNTTLNELKRAFPSSYKIWEKKNEKYNSKIFSLWPSESSDSEFHIIIEKGKITEFKIYHPC